MKLEAVFIPSELRRDSAPVCVLVDAIRASSTIITFFAQGSGCIFLTRDEESSITTDCRITQEDYCICAECVEGDKAELAHVSPSLAEIQRLGYLNDKKVLFRTTNGSLGVHILHQQGIQEIYIGSMLNRDAVMQAAIQRAQELSTGVCIVCAGRGNGTIYCIDDAYCSGKLVESGIAFAKKEGIVLDLQDSAKIALGLLQAYPSTQEAFAQSATGQIMRNIQTEIDITLCARDNIFDVVPNVTGCDSYGHIMIEKEI